MDEKTIDIGLFPLGVFLLPGERTPLHIFEARYQQLFDRVEEANAEFGIPYSKGSKPGQMGSKCRLVKVTKKYHGGIRDVLVECTDLFLLKDYSESTDSTLYPFGTIETVKDINDWTVGEEVLAEFAHYVKVMEASRLPFGHPVGNEFVAILSSLNLPSEEKYKMVRIADKVERDHALLNAIRYGRMLVEQENQVEDGIYLS